MAAPAALWLASPSAGARAGEDDTPEMDDLEEAFDRLLLRFQVGQDYAGRAAFMLHNNDEMEQNALAWYRRYAYSEAVALAGNDLGRLSQESIVSALNAVSTIVQTHLTESFVIYVINNTNKALSPAFYTCVSTSPVRYVPSGGHKWIRENRSEIFRTLFGHGDSAGRSDLHTDLIDAKVFLGEAAIPPHECRAAGIPLGNLYELVPQCAGKYVAVCLLNSDATRRVFIPGTDIIAYGCQLVPMN